MPTLGGAETLQLYFKAKHYFQTQPGRSKKEIILKYSFSWKVAAHHIHAKIEKGISNSHELCKQLF